jgi:hypothetical protein
MSIDICFVRELIEEGVIPCPAWKPRPQGDGEEGGKIFMKSQTRMKTDKFFDYFLPNGS